MGVQKPHRTSMSGPVSRPRDPVCFIGLSVLFLFTLYAAIWVYHFASSQLDAETPVAVVLALVFALALSGPWLVIRFGSQARRTVARYADRGIRSLAASRGARAVATRFPRTAQFIADRLARSSATGLGLSITLVLATAIAWFFGEILFDVVTNSSVYGTDRRILHLAATFRTPQWDQVMVLITFLGNAEVIAIVTSLAVVLLFLLGRRKDAVLVLAAVISSVLFVLLLKLLVGRPRPSPADALLIQGGFSFPSGHSAISAVLYGTLAYLLVRNVRRPGWKVLIGTGTAVLVVAIGLSRVYLGVHYPSDVLAGWAVGALWVLWVGILEDLWQAPPARLLSRERRRVIALVMITLVVVGGAYLTNVYRQSLALTTPIGTAPHVLEVAMVPLTVETQIPRHTEDLFGHQQEPINLIFVGTRAQLEETFAAAGWVQAQPFGLSSVAQGIGAALTERPLADGPGLPSFWDDEPETMAFSFPVGASFAQRHHIRLWRTDYLTTDGRAVWVATASFDRGFELARTTFLPTHAIAPDIDTERTFVVSSLARTRHIANAASIRLIPPEHGYNVAGDPYYTDGEAVILLLH